MTPVELTYPGDDATLQLLRGGTGPVDIVNAGKPNFTYKCLCPFHKEQTPSFHWDQRKGVYYCFGCHTKGTSLDLYTHLVQEAENRNDLIKQGLESVPESEIGKANSEYIRGDTMSYPNAITVREKSCGTIRFNSEEEYKEWLADQADGNHDWPIKYHSTETTYHLPNGDELEVEPLELLE